MSRHKHHQRLKITDEEDLIPKSIIYEEPELNTRIEKDITNNIYLLVKTKTSEGSIINSILTLISFSPTCTFFFVPFALSFHYMIPGILIFMLTALLSYYTLFLLLKVIVEKQAISHSYTDIITSLLSKKQSVMINIIMIIHYFGLSIIYVYIGKELMVNIAIEWFKSENRQEIPSKWLISLVTQIVGIIIFEIIFALIQKKNLTKLLHSLVMLSIVFLIITQIIIIFNNNFQFKKTIEGDIYQIGNIFSIATLGLTNHLYYNRGLKDLTLFSQKRGKSLIIWSIIGEFMFYITLNLVHGLLEKKADKDPLGYFKEPTNFYSELFGLFIFIFLQFKVSNIWITLIDNIFSIDKIDNEEPSSTPTPKYSTKVLCIILGLIISNIIAYFLNYDDSNSALILIVIWIVGGLCASILCFILPIILYLKVFPETLNGVKLFQLFILVVSLVLIGLGLISAIRTIVKN